ARAQYHLAVMHDRGANGRRDPKAAAQLYRRAAEQGDSRAQYDLAQMYLAGEGVPRDEAEALKWFLASARRGSALARYNLGICYAKGRGCVADPVEAHAWLCLAAASGHDKVADPARRGAAALAEALGPDGLAKSRKRQAALAEVAS
ncbi:MAG TPA: tetratricopeptide repeat protein, partial [Candidatus Omnitrophota bacterium]|nr:tetratricopeptide repeat protein [Candidatus Omnitrophota bacterium]